jgi:hypothetical protein
MATVPDRRSPKSDADYLTSVILFVGQGEKLCALHKPLYQKNEYG